MQIERRRHIRVPGPFAAAVRVDGKNTPARILNLSEGGCYVEGVTSTPAVGCAVTLEIELPNAAPLVVTGETSLRRPHGYAVLFQPLSETTYADLERAIADLREDAL